MTLRSHRASSAEWKKIFVATHNSLMKSGASNAILFGSQALSAYLKRALPSKDLDLIVEGVRMQDLKRLSQDLSDSSILSPPRFDYSVGDYLGREYPVAHFYLRPKTGKPFVVELFYNFLGYDVRRLDKYVLFKKCWGIDVQIPTPEAIVATRLAFRPPERITPFNAKRLNLFIRAMQRTIDWKGVNDFIADFNLQNLISKNISELRKKHNIGILHSEELSLLSNN